MVMALSELFSGMPGMIIICNYSVFQERLIEDVLEYVLTGS